MRKITENVQGRRRLCIGIVVLVFAFVIAIIDCDFMSFAQEKSKRLQLTGVEWQADYYSIAVSCSKKLEFTVDENVVSVNWKSSDNTVAMVDSYGLVTGVGEGEATINLVVTLASGKTNNYNAFFCVTNPILESESVDINIYDQISSVYRYNFAMFKRNSIPEIDLSGVSYYSNVELVSNDDNLICNAVMDAVERDVVNIRFFALAPGDYEVTVLVDGISLDIDVRVRTLYLKRDKNFVCDEQDGRWKDISVILVEKGKEYKLPVRGVLKGDKVTYKSNDTSVVTVNKNGRIKAKGYGEAIVTVTNGGMSIDCHIGVTSKGAINALLYMGKHYDASYSQSKRMEKDYYDCSSFVWRAYASAKIYVGPNKTWAPTAADMAKWCVKQGYMVYEGTVKIDDLLPGDLVFLTGKSNGRYKGIDHVYAYKGNRVYAEVGRGNVSYDNHFVEDTIDNVMVARVTCIKPELQKLTLNKNRVTLKWSSVYSADGYQIYRSTSENGDYKKIATVKGQLQYVDKNVKKGKTYYYKIKAFWKSSKTYCGKESSVVKIKINK